MPSLTSLLTNLYILASATHQRHLLQMSNASLPNTTKQFCYPTGACDLGVLSNGFSGLVLQGEAAGDQSGCSVSAAGDINGDGISDLIVGAYYADLLGKSDAGKGYVIFGSNSSTAWSGGIFDLSSLMDGQRGFVLQYVLMKNIKSCAKNYSLSS